MRVEASFNNISKLLQGAASASKPSSIPISEKLTSQERGLERATDNSRDAINLSNTAEGALNSVSDSLGRMRELAVQAGNGTLTDSDRSTIQNEINGLKSGINDVLQNTEFNSIKVFDNFKGSVQTGPNAGQNREIIVENTSIESLGIDGFDVTEDFDIAEIDKAIEKVSESRSNLGAQSNSLESNIRSNEVARENTLSSRSNAIGEDFEKSIIQLRQAQLKQQIENQTQSLQQKNEENRLSVLG